MSRLPDHPALSEFEIALQSFVNAWRGLPLAGETSFASLARAWLVAEVKSEPSHEPELWRDWDIERWEPGAARDEPDGPWRAGSTPFWPPPLAGEGKDERVWRNRRFL